MRALSLGEEDHVGVTGERGRGSGRAIRRGEIPRDGVLGILREVESLHVTGVLRFAEGPHTGTIALERGQIASEQPEQRADPVETFLNLRGGRFEVLQILPPLDGATGDAERREGVIGAHAVADLMSYCERAGLTGVLRLERAGVTAEAVYDRGELTGLVVSGGEAESQGAEVEDVFAWSEGVFTVEARSTTPPLPEATPSQEIPDVFDTIPAPPPPPRPDTTQTRLLRVVEMSLADVLRKREERRPSVRPASLAPSPEEDRKEATVRVVFLGTTGEAIVERVPRKNALPDSDPPVRAEGSGPTSHGKRGSAPEVVPPREGAPVLAITGLVLLLLAGLAAFLVTLLRLR